MDRHAREQRRPPAGQPSPSALPVQSEPFAYPEPEMRRWPHPIVSNTSEPEPQALSASLHYINCALSYQNQLLSEIKILLEALTSDEDSCQAGK